MPFVCYPRSPIFCLYVLHACSRYIYSWVRACVTSKETSPYPSPNTRTLSREHSRDSIPPEVVCCK